MSWTPLLEGGLKDRAMESIATVLDALSTRERDLDGSPSLAGGTAGRRSCMATWPRPKAGKTMLLSPPGYSSAPRLPWRTIPGSPRSTSDWRAWAGRWPIFKTASPASEARTN